MAPISPGTAQLSWIRMRVRTVVAEDDLKQAELVRRYLEREGHAVTVVHDGPAAIEAVRRTDAELLVLDVMLPGADGFAVCHALGDAGDLCILMLTARATEDDVLRGLDLGADDYMTKPFSPRELTARVRALLRRVRKRGAAVRALEVGGLVVDPVAHEATCDGAPVHLTPGEFTLLEHMAAEPGRVFTRAQLLELLHGSDRYITVRTVDMHVMNLRRKIEPEPQRPARLVTVYGVGYKLVDPT
jgi:DNA-binding response OmpR family regulator